MRNTLIPIAFAVALVIAGCTKQEGTNKPAADAKEVIIGEYGSMTGGEATFGISTHQGLMLAVKEQNAQGGIGGKTIKVSSVDDQGKPEDAVTAVSKLITQDRAVAIIGEVASSRSLAAAPTAQQYKVPMISPSSTNPKVTEVGDYIFRVCFTDPFQGTVMAKFAYNNLKIRKVSIMRDAKSDYSQGLSAFFKETFTKMGGQVVSEETYVSNDIDFKAQLTSIKSVKPDAIFIPGYYTEVGLIARQARGLGIKIPLLGGDGWDSTKLVEIGKDAIIGTYFSNHYSTDAKDPRARNFFAAFKKQYGSAPDGLSAMGYDAGKVLFDAMKRAQSLEPSDIRDALAATKNFPAVTGVITIDAQRNASKPAVVVRVEQDRNVFVTSIDP